MTSILNSSIPPELQAAIQDFSNKADIGVMLVSLKAASLGVNLVSANHVVLLVSPAFGLS